MTKTQASNYARLLRTCEQLGISREDFDSLLRIEKTLHRWAERECNGEVEVDEIGDAWGRRAWKPGVAYAARWAVPNREAGALRRLAAIMARYPKLRSFHQTDPRGCALYVFEHERYVEACRARPASAQALSIESCYSSVGVAMGV